MSACLCALHVTATCAECGRPTAGTLTILDGAVICNSDGFLLAGPPDSLHFVCNACTKKLSLIQKNTIDLEAVKDEARMAELAQQLAQQLVRTMEYQPTVQRN